MNQYITHNGLIKSYDPENSHSNLLIDELFDRTSKTHDIINNIHGKRETYFMQNKETDKIDGYCVTLFNKKIIKLESYKNGIKNGFFYSWYLTGQRHSEQLFVNDNPHGYHTVWNVEGDIIEITRFSDNLYDGFHIKYERETNTLEEVSRYRENI